MRLLLEEGGVDADLSTVRPPPPVTRAIARLLFAHLQLKVRLHVIGPRREHPARRIDDLVPRIASFLLAPCIET